MNTYRLTNLLLCALLVSCDEKSAQKSSSLPKTENTSIQEIGRQLKQKAGKKIKEVMEAGQPRVVSRGAKPEIIIGSDQIHIDGKQVAMGDSIERWKAALPGRHRCDGELGKIACRWDNLGITLLAEDGAVRHFIVHFNLTPWMEFARTGPDSVWAPPYPDLRPKYPFRGYFELDGYGIDANTQFWEIRASIAPERNVQCELFTNNCGNTIARFGPGAKIFFELYESTSEEGRLADFTIGVIPPPVTSPGSAPAP